MKFTNPPPSIGEGKDIRKILVLKGDHLGDLMLAVPAVDSVKRAFPDASITLASSKQGESLYRALKLIDEHILFSSPGLVGYPIGSYARLIRKIRSERFDLIINFRHDFRDILISQFLGGRFLCTYDHKGVGLLADFRALPGSETKYEAENNLNLVSMMGIEKSIYKVPLDQKAEKYIKKKCDNGRWIVLHPFSRTPAKQWPISNFSHLAALLSEADYHVACVGGKSDRAKSTELLKDCKRSVDFTGRISFEQLFSLLHMSIAFIGIDSFVMHAAKATDTNGLAIFSGTNRQIRWAPAGFSIVNNPVDCAPCGLENCTVQGHPCLTEITVERVMENFKNLVAGE